jgi:hypothetical protein
MGACERVGESEETLTRKNREKSFNHSSDDRLSTVLKHKKHLTQGNHGAHLLF